MLYEKVLEKGCCTAISTEGMSESEWLEKRRAGIGGSDSGAILGMNKYATPLSVYIAKKGLLDVADGLNANNQSIKWGKMAEAAIREGLAKDLGLNIETAPVMFTSRENPFMLADLDGLVFVPEAMEIEGKTVEGIGGLEIKTATSRNQEFGSDEIPDSYYCQVQHYMAVTGLMWFILAVLIDKADGKIYVVPRNDEFIGRLVEEEENFWNDNVLANNPPAPTGNENEFDIVKSLPMSEEVELDGECETMLDEKELLDAQIKELQAKSDAIKEQILMRMSAASNGEGAEKSTAMCGSWKITYNTQVSRRVDTNALKKAGLYDEYARESVSRVLRITRAKGTR